MKKSSWTPLDLKAIDWYSKEHGLRLQLPLAWPQVTYIQEDGTKLVKEVYHLKDAYKKWRAAKKPDKQETA